MENVESLTKHSSFFEVVERQQNNKKRQQHWGKF